MSFLACFDAGQREILTLSHHVRQLCQGDFLTIDEDGYALPARMGHIVKAISCNEVNSEVPLEQLASGRISAVISGRVLTSNFVGSTKYKPLDKIYIIEMEGDSPKFTNYPDCRPDSFCGYVFQTPYKDANSKEMVLGVHFNPFLVASGLRISN